MAERLCLECASHGWIPTTKPEGMLEGLGCERCGAVTETVEQTLLF